METGGMENGWKRAWKRSSRGVLDLLFPPVCIACREPVGDIASFCPDCWGAIQFLDGPLCACCGIPFELDPGSDARCATCLAHPPSFDRARAVMRYDEKSRAPILALKHSDRLDLAPGFARWLERTGRELLAEADIIAPVPLHRVRLWTRRYNQSAELMRALCRLTGKPADPFLLERTRSTPSQGAMKSARARRRNVRNAFQIPPSRAAALDGKTVLLIDDVLTTGATVNACAAALKRAGAAKVHILALARVVRPLTEVI